MEDGRWKFADGSRNIANTEPNHGGAKATAVQTLRDCQASMNRAKRLDCGAFTAAFRAPLASSCSVETIAVNVLGVGSSRAARTPTPSAACGRRWACAKMTATPLVPADAGKHSRSATVSTIGERRVSTKQLPLSQLPTPQSCKHPAPTAFSAPTSAIRR